jgi:hypothetical protein
MVKQKTVCLFFAHLHTVAPISTRFCMIVEAFLEEVPYPWKRAFGSSSDQHISTLRPPSEQHWDRDKCGAPTAAS